MSHARDWLIDVPSHWTVCALKRIVSLKSGESINSDSIETEGEYPVFGGNGVRGYTSGYTHEGSYVLIGRQGALCGNINYAHGRFWASEHAVVVTPTAPVAIRWLGELLRAMNLNRYSMSAAQPGLSVEIVGNLKIPVPPVAEQVAIAAFLDREITHVDRLIRKKERLIELLKVKCQALCSHAVTGGQDPSVPMRSTDSAFVPYIPSHWSLPRLKQLATVRGGITLGRQLPQAAKTIEVPYLRVANVQAGWADLSDVTTLHVLTSELDRYRLKKGDVLMNEGGDNDKLGRGVVWDGQIDPCLHQNHVFAVRPKDSELSEWISVCSNAKYGRDFFFLNSKQSTNLASVAKSKVEQFPIPFPPDEERQEILEFVRSKVRVIKEAELRVQQSIYRLYEVRSALITAAVTGQIDVETWRRRRDTDRRPDALEEGWGHDNIISHGSGAPGNRAGRAPGQATSHTARLH